MSLIEIRDQLICHLFKKVVDQIKIIQTHSRQEAIALSMLTFLGLLTQSVLGNNVLKLTNCKAMH
jgi:hypothetical protein